MPVYEKLFNSILNQGTMPQTWCGGLISPIYKSGGRGDPANYRGICVSSCKFKNCKTDAVIIRILTDVSAMLPSSGYTKGRCEPVTTCCFSSGIALKIVAFSLETSCLCCHENEMWQCFSLLLSRQFPACFDHVRVMYHDRDTFDSSQGHVTKNQPVAVPV